MSSLARQHDPSIPRRRGRGVARLAIALLALVVSASAHAGQILVNPSDDWAAKAAKAKPGDEIVLMPGRHRAASFDRLVGTAEAPITIRGASKEKAAIISAQLDGIRVKEGAHLVIKDLQIIGGSASGIWIAAPLPADAARGAGEDPAALRTRTERARDIVIDNVAITKVGPRGQRHGIYIQGFGDVRINRAVVEGWGGSAIELVACEDVTITRCILHGIKDHSQYCGIRARAGCDRVSISETRFENAGDIAVCMGGKSNPEEYIPPIPADATNASMFEASRVAVEQSVFIGSLCPVAMIHAVDCLVRSSTILRPRRCVIAMLHQSPDVRIKASSRNLFGGNLVIWQSGDITKFVEVDEAVDASAFILEPNMWWSNDTPEQRGKLGPLPGNGNMQIEQVFDVDPKLNAALKPTAAAAKPFGATL